jgi:hypothetical protein
MILPHGKNNRCIASKLFIEPLTIFIYFLKIIASLKLTPESTIFPMFDIWKVVDLIMAQTFTIKKYFSTPCN